MKTRNHIHKIYYPILGVLLLLYTLGGVAWAINTIADGFRAPLNVTIRVDARGIYGDCKDITTQAVADAFVPTATLSEWNTFKSNKPTTIRVAACGYNQCTAAGQAYDIAKVGGNACNTNDKIICTGNGIGYTWSMCNVGTNTAGAHGSLYQWGRVKTFSPSGSEPALTSGPVTVATSNGTNNFINLDHDNNYGDWLSGRSTSRGFAVCPSGYHVPSKTEWCQTAVALGVTGACGVGGYIQGGGGTTVTNSLLRTTLAFPLSGVRTQTAGIQYSYGTDGGYWSSTPYSEYTYAFIIGSASVVYGYDNRGDAMSVRCVRDD